jgi:hypothetical protein
LKPNISKDWVKELRKQLKSEIKDPTSSSESMSSYTSDRTGNQSQDVNKKTRLSDLTADQIQIKDNVKFNPSKLNLSVSASQNKKNMQN